MDSSNKIHMICLAAGSAALAGIGLYLFSRQQKQYGDIIDDIKHLGAAKYTDDDKKLITEQFFTDLVAVVRMHTSIEFKAEKAELLDKRQTLFKAEADKDEASDEYIEYVREIYIKEETIFNALIDEALDELDIDHDVFLES